MSPQELLLAVMELLEPTGDADQVAKEMYDAEYTHVDAVKGPAHGMKFAVVKSQQRPTDRMRFVFLQTERRR